MPCWRLVALVLAGASAAQAADSLRALFDGDEWATLTPALQTELLPWLGNDDRDGARNRVLNAMEAGSVSFARGELAFAEKFFSRAQAGIETIYADDPAAQAARSKFVPESSKEFKGDPYERAMVGYYLGVIDLSRGDYDNARAGFRFAQLQDTMSASETYQDDMALMQYLVAWTYWCEGSELSAQEEWTRARQRRADFPLPERGANLLLLAETGRAPIKFSAGEYKELLQYRTGPLALQQQVAFAVGAQQINGIAAEDLYFQASTRGGSAVANIREGKASFRRTADTIANVGSTVTNVAAGTSILQQVNGDSGSQMTKVAAVAGVVTIVSAVFGNNTETQADTRYWRNLPATIHFALGSISPEAKPEVGAFAADGKVLQSQAMWLRSGGSKKCALAYARVQERDGQWAQHKAAQWQALPRLKNADSSLLPTNLPEATDEGDALMEMVRQMRQTTSSGNNSGATK